MPRRQAIDIAMDAVSRPQLLAMLTVGPLPPGVKSLLRIVAEGECRDSSTEHVYSKHSADAVRGASSAFLVAVLFDKISDPYRVLGLAKGAPAADVREHKRLMLKWLHPDRNPHSGERKHLPKVIEACEAIDGGHPLAAEKRHAGDFSFAFAEGPGRSGPARVPPADTALIRGEPALRKAMAEIMRRLAGAARAGILGAGVLLVLLASYRYLLGEPIGNAIERYARLTIGLVSW